MSHRRLVGVVGIAISLLLWPGYGRAQDEIPSPSPEPSLSPTLEPSSMPTPTEAIEATVTPLPSDTLEPTLTIIPSETPLAEATDEPPDEATPTDTPSEIPEITATFTPVEDTPASPEATATSDNSAPTVMLTPVDLPREPAMALRVIENFDSGDLAGWRFAAAGWVLVPHDEGLALQVFNSESPAELVQPDFLNVAAQAEVLLDYGGARLEVRRSAVGRYAATLDSAGQVNLYRAGTLLMAAQVAPSLPGQWRTLRLSAVNGVLRVWVDDLEVIALPDTATLPPGGVSLSGIFDLSEEAQPPQNTLQVDDFRLFVPEAELPSPTPTTLPTPTPPDLAIPAPQAESNGIFVVNTVEDTIDGECSQLHCSLREAIIAANAYGGGAIVTIPSGTYKLSIAGSSEDESQTGDLDITASVMIQGAGTHQTIIDADGLDRVFDVRYSDSTFSDLTITGGYAYTDFQNGDGGGLRVYDSSVTLTNVIIEHNTALTYRGGGVSINSGPVPKMLTLDHSLIRDNTADVGGGLYLSGANALITETTISGNTSASSLGGGIFVSRMWDDPVDGVHLSGVTISGNSATQGGGVYAAGTAVLSIVNSTISGNHADEAGGGLVTTTYAETTLNNVTITQNTVDQDGSGQALGGGGIYTGFYYDTPVLHIRNSIIAGNTNTTGTTPDCSDGLGSGTIESLGHNLIGDLSGCTLTGDTGSNHIGQAPILGALEDNGGSTQTHALLEGSPAIDAGEDTTCEATDQRGVTRPQGAACDIGAFESGFVVQPLATPEADLALTASDSPDPVTVGEDLIYALTITNNGPDTASSLRLVQTLPPGVTFVSANPSQGGCVESSGEVTCDSATLAVDASMQVAIRVHVEPGTQGTLISSVQVSAAQSDADSTNNTVEITTITVQPLKPGAPRLLEPANGSPTRNTTPTLTWMAVTYATSYQVQIDDDSRFRSPTEDRVVSDPAYLVSTALADGRYYWRVRASNSLSVLGSWSGARNFVVDTLPPPVPVLTGPKDGATATTARPKFTWKASSGANRYWLQVDDEDTFSDPRWIDQEINRTTYTSTLSLPQGTYFYRVMAGDAAGNWSEFGAPFTFRVDIQKSPAETTFTNDTTPSFQWYRYTDAIAYRLELAADVDFTLPAAPFPVDTTARTTGYTLPKANALPYGIYYWRVSVDTGTGFVTSPFYRTLVISPTFPKAPGLISPANSALTADNQPGLEWGATVSTDGAPFTYQLQIDNDSRFRSPEQDTTTADLTYLAAPLADGRYYWRVRTVNYLGAPGGWSRARTFTVDTTPPVITQLTSPVSDATVTTTRPALRWKATGSPVSFDVQVGKDNPPITPLLTVKTSAYTPVSPLSATTYFWRVRARDAAGNVSEWSSISPFTIISPSNATPPLNFAGSDDPILSWTPISWALGYEVQAASRSNFSQPEFATNTLGPDVLSVTVDVPLPNGTYYWRVRARRSATSWGKWSSTGTFQVER